MYDDPIEKSMVWAFRNKFLNLSHASYNDSSSNWLKLVISILNLAVLSDEKYLLKNTLDKSSQIVKVLGAWEYSQILTLSQRKWEQS